jgi:hypothetical protein
MVSMNLKDYKHGKLKQDQPIPIEQPCMMGTDERSNLDMIIKHRFQS